MRARVSVAMLALAAYAGASTRTEQQPKFLTSDRCIACHNELTTPQGEDVSIGFAWRASVMANSSRDPYWQASVRRETIDHPQHVAHIEDECSICHMPVTRYEAKIAGKQGRIFAHLPFETDKEQGAAAADGVDCSICHQISKEKLGTRESFNGGFVIEAPDVPHARPEYGPFQIDAGQARIMQSSTRDFQPTENTDHIRKSELCATCHTLITTAFGPDGQAIGSLPEQMPYKEWLASDYKTKQTCQDCHMPVVAEPTPITRVFGVPREGMKRHVFTGGNFFLQWALNRYRGDLETAALPQELDAAAQGTIRFLQEKSARVSVENVRVSGGHVDADVVVENLTGHKLPTAYPSRRAWIYFSVRDHVGRVLFESGKLRADGSIVGNDNDADARKYEPHYTEVTNAGQVQIYEDILGDPKGQVTTGLLTAVGYLKDNRLLPHGFDKTTGDRDIAVMGAAREDANFAAGGDRVRYSVDVAGGAGPLRIIAELWYEPIGFRWANNLKAYGQAQEPRRFNAIYEAMGQATAQVLARAEVQQ